MLIKNKCNILYLNDGGSSKTGKIKNLKKNTKMDRTNIKIFKCLTILKISNMMSIFIFLQTLRLMLAAMYSLTCQNTILILFPKDC